MVPGCTSPSLMEENSGKYFEAWKSAVLKARSSLFNASKETVEEATDKNRLRPNLDAIIKYMGVCSGGEALFLGVLYTFINGEDGKNYLISIVWNIKSWVTFHRVWI